MNLFRDLWRRMLLVVWRIVVEGWLKVLHEERFYI